MRRLVLKSLALPFILAASLAPVHAAENFKVMIGANPGGGYDQAGRGIGKALQEAGVAASVTFENKGEVVGVSNPHPHCQIYATNFVFKFIESEARACRSYRDQTGRVLFQDILKAEQDDGRRIIFENSSAIAFLPYFARYAYECYVAPKGTHPTLSTLSTVELKELAEALKVLLVRYDNLWRMPFPYVMTLHQAPTDGADYSSFQFHFEFHPPLRKPHLLKYLAGPEIGGGNFLSDTLPEEKAEELRRLPDVHYRQQQHL